MSQSYSVTEVPIMQKKKREKSISALSDKKTKKLLKKILNEVEKPKKKKKSSRNSSWDKKTQRSSSIKRTGKIKRQSTSIYDHKSAREILEPRNDSK